MQRRRRDDQIRLQEGVAGFAPLLDHEAPLQHDVLGDRQRPLGEHRPDAPLAANFPIAHKLPTPFLSRIQAVRNEIKS
jgi:hypothetical protein